MVHETTRELANTRLRQIENQNENQNQNRTQPTQNRTLFSRAAFIAGALVSAIRSNPISSAAAFGAGAALLYTKTGVQNLPTQPVAPLPGALLFVGEEHNLTPQATVKALHLFKPTHLLTEAIGPENGGQRYINKTRKQLVGMPFNKLLESNPIGTDFLLWMANQVNSSMVIRAFGQSDTIATSKNRANTLQITHQDTAKAMKYANRILKNDPYARIMVHVGSSHLLPAGGRVLPMNIFVKELDLQPQAPYDQRMNSKQHNSSHVVHVSAAPNQQGGKDWTVSNVSSFDLLHLFPAEKTSALIFIPEWMESMTNRVPSGMRVVFEPLSQNPQNNVDRVKDFFDQLAQGD